MKLEVLKRVLEDNYTDDEKIIRVQGVRDGKNYVLYEAWSGDDELVLSVAEEGSLTRFLNREALETRLFNLFKESTV